MPVQVFLTATGKNASSMPPQLDLSVSVDDQTAQVVSLRSAREYKLLFALLVDTSASTAKRADSVRNAAWQVFAALSSEGAQGYLVFFNTQVVMSTAPLQPPAARAALDDVKFGGGTALFDAIWDTCKKALKRSANPDAPRRAVLLLSDGDDDQSRAYPNEAEQAAEAEGVAIFSLTEYGSPTGEHLLREASQDTGGQTIVVGDVKEGVTPFLAAIQGQWALTVLPQQTPDQRLHSLKVKSTQKNVRISAPAQIPLQ